MFCLPWDLIRPLSQILIAHNEKSLHLLKYENSLSSVILIHFFKRLKIYLSYHKYWYAGADVFLQNWPTPHVPHLSTWPLSASQAIMYFIFVSSFVPLPPHLTHHPLLKTISRLYLNSFLSSHHHHYLPNQNIVTSHPDKSNPLLPGFQTAARSIVFCPPFRKFFFLFHYATST